MNPTQTVRHVALLVLGELASTDGVTLQRLTKKTAASESNVRRAIEWLRHLGAAVVYATRGWVIEDPTWRMPELGMAAADVVAQRSWSNLAQWQWTCERSGYQWLLKSPWDSWTLLAAPPGRPQLSEVVSKGEHPPRSRDLRLAWGDWLVVLHTPTASSLFGPRDEATL